MRRAGAGCLAVALIVLTLDLAPTGEGFEQVDLRKDSPFACGDKDGVFFTGHWAVRTPTDYDAAGFVESLAGQLGSDFEPQSTLASSRARFLSSPDDVLVTVTAVQKEDGFSSIDILGQSTCAEPPGE